MRKALWTAAVAALVVAVNAGAWFAAVHGGGGARDPFWDRLESVGVQGRADVAASFPAALRAEEGSRVRVSGVAFVTDDGLDGDRVRWCVLMPPGRYGCCGISCDPRPEMSVFVDCSARPWPSGGRRQVLASVEGVLRLDRAGGSWCLSSLEDAVVLPVEP